MTRMRIIALAGVYCACWRNLVMRHVLEVLRAVRCDSNGGADLRRAGKIFAGMI